MVGPAGESFFFGAARSETCRPTAGEARRGGGMARFVAGATRKGGPKKVSEENQSQPREGKSCWREVGHKMR